MLTNHKRGGVFLTLIFLLICNFCYAVDWSGTQAGYTNSTAGTTVTINLTGNVTLTKPIVAGYGKAGESSPRNAKIIIQNATNGPVTISKGSGLSTFLRIWEGATIHVKGSSGKEIIFDAGGGLGAEMIASTGNLILEYATLKNHTNNNLCPDPKDTPYCAIKLACLNDVVRTMGTTTIKYCLFDNIHCPVGSIIYAPSYAKSAASNNRTNNKITISNTIIQNCSATKHDGGTDPADEVTPTDAGGGWAGIIRTKGGWVGDMELNKVTIQDCHAEFSCAGVFWNACGDAGNESRQPYLTIKGCKFLRNTAKISGGAMRIEAFCKFEPADDGTPTEIAYNTAGVMGGGIHIYGYAGGNMGSYNFKYDLKALNIHDNTAQYGGGIGIQITPKCTLVNGSSFNINFNGATVSNNHAKIKGGGIFYENTAEAEKGYVLNLYLNKGTLEGNYAAPTKTETYDTRYEGGFYGSDEKWRSCGGGIFLNKANIEYNSAEAGDMILNNNFASLNGGAIFVTGEKNYLKLNSLSASNNKANNGGAVACISINEPSSQTNPTTYQSAVTVDNAKFTGNYAAQRGGAIYSERGNVTLQNEAEFKSNHAEWCGGAIYSYFKSYLTIGKVSFLNNWCDYTGMENNTAQNKGLGGAICIEQGCTLTIGSNDASKETIFDGNHCQNSGGALHVVNTWTNPACYDYVTGSIKNATFKNNYAYRGGAICFDGEGSGDNIQPTLKNNKIINNKANIGGGLYLSQCKIKYEGGLVKNNYAEGNSITAKTSYEENPWLDTTSDFHKLAGFGGGVFMTTNGYLDISTAYDFGIYGNRADTGGDDITCQKTTGTINLPDVTSLNLEGFTVPVPKTAVRWMEDYNKEDSNYSYGTNKLSGTTNYDRYTNLLASATGQALLSKVIVAPGTYTGKYLNLALGYNFIFVKVRKHGLKVGDSAIFKISYDNNGSKTHYMTIAVTNTGTNQNADGSVEQTVALTQGTWTVEETSWSWTYTPSTSSIAKTLTIEENSATPFVFDFTNTRKDGIDSTAPNAEGYKQNEFNK